MDFYINNTASITTNSLLTAFESRFTGKLFLIQVANRFQRESIPESIREYFSMLSDAKYIHERGYMSLEAILNKIIERSPSEIRTVLWAQAGVINNIYELSQVAENIIPLAYGSKGTLVEAQRAQISHQTDESTSRIMKSQRTCLIHGDGSHYSKECKVILRERSKFLKNQRKAHVVEIHEKEPSINQFDYSLFCSSVTSTKTPKNPLKTTIRLGKITYPALIDTGADVSFIPQSFFGALKSKHTDLKAQAAN